VNIQKLMRQAQQMQEKMQRELGALVVEASVGGGVVKARMTGHKVLVGIEIDPEVLEARDAAMLQDLVVSAVNEAGRKVDEEMQARLGPMASGIPGLS
jgi:DNA-binding YbaB/EbfC family protein